MAKQERSGRRNTDIKAPKKTVRATKEPTPSEPRISLFEGLSDETRHSVIAILFFVIGIFFSVAPFGKAGLMGSSIYGGTV